MFKKTSDYTGLTHSRPQGLFLYFGSGYKTANNITAKLQNSEITKERITEQRSYKTAKLQNSEVTKQRMIQNSELC